MKALLEEKTLGRAEIVPVINREIDRAPSRPGPDRVHPGLASPLHPHFEQDGGIWPVHCVRDTWGVERHPELKVAGDVVRRAVNLQPGDAKRALEEMSHAGLKVV